MPWHRLEAGELLPDGRLRVPVWDSRTGAELPPEVIDADYRLYGLYRPAWAARRTMRPLTARTKRPTTGGAAGSRAPCCPTIPC